MPPQHVSRRSSESMKRSSVLTFARAFNDVYGLDCARRLHDIALLIGLTITEVEADSFEGALVRVAGLPRGEILINSNVKDPHRRRFTVLHEIGHYVLPDHDKAAHPCRSRDIENFSSESSRRELEANTFAAAVGMPDQIAEPIAKRMPSFDALDELALACGMSLTASAYRIVECTTHAVALVWSQAGVARWYHRSAEFTPKVRVGPLSQRSLASDYFTGQRPSERTRTADVPAEAWLYEDVLRDDAVVRETTRYLPAYDATLTLIAATTFIEARSNYLDPDDRELNPDEFTLGRRRWPSR